MRGRANVRLRGLVPALATPWAAAVSTCALAAGLLTQQPWLSGAGALGLSAALPLWLRRRRDAPREGAEERALALLAHMRHELRGPLHGVLDASRSLLDTELDEPQREYVEMIRGGAGSLLGTIDRMLELSRLETGTASLSYTRFNLRVMTEEVLALFAARAERKGVMLACSLPVGVPLWVGGDAERLRQVLTGLVGNAVELTHEGQVFVQVWPEAELQDHRILVRFEVCDTGPGLGARASDEQAPGRRRVRDAPAGEDEGEAVDLAVAKELVTLMGGRIGVRSEAEVGSTFWFTVPLGRERDSAELLAPPEWAELRALIVQPRQIGRTALQERLEQLGIHVDTADDEAEALRLTCAPRGDEHGFDLVFIDHQLAEVAALVRAIRAEGRSRILMVSSARAHAQRQSLVDAGVRAFVHEPVRQRQLVVAIRRALAGHPSVAPHASGAPPASMSSSAPPRARVLAMEDDSTNRRLLRRVLERRGYLTAVVPLSERALSVLDAMTFDVVVIDCHNDPERARQLVTRIRSGEDERRRVSIVGLVAATAHSVDIDLDAMTALPPSGERIACTIAQLQERSPPHAAQRPAEAPNASPVVDLSALESQAARLGDTRQLADVVESYLDTLDELMMRIRRAVQQAEQAELSAATRELSELSEGAGARQLALLSYELSDSEVVSARTLELTMQLEDERVRVVDALLRHGRAA